MTERKEIRRRARHILKAHYLAFVAACLMAAVLGTEYTNSLQLLRLQRRVHNRQTIAAPALGVGASSGEMSVFNDIINGDLDSAIRFVQHRMDVYTGEDTHIGDIEKQPAHSRDLRVV